MPNSAHRPTSRLPDAKIDAWQANWGLADTNKAALRDIGSLPSAMSRRWSQLLQLLPAGPSKPRPGTISVFQDHAARDGPKSAICALGGEGRLFWVGHSNRTDAWNVRVEGGRSSHCEKKRIAHFEKKRTSHFEKNQISHFEKSHFSHFEKKQISHFEKTRASHSGKPFSMVRGSQTSHFERKQN